ncbi:MAG: glycosyltransferase family 4 protein [Chloroflexi bacterium]|nr:glycosyltransferase family 4 protein [Chloroflexota bacterium]
MRIAQLASPFVPVPPKKYGGTERVIAALTEQLVARGHEVTLFASGDSQTSARLVPVVPEALWEQTGWDPKQVVTNVLAFCYAHADEFDIIHNHLDHAAFPFARQACTPTVTTCHGRQDLPELPAIYAEYREMPLVSISNSQRRPVRWANWVATVYNGVVLDELPFSPTGGEYLLFVGRISPEKGVDAAIRIARRAGVRLVIAAREPLPFTADPVVQRDWDYYEGVVKPLLREPGVEFVGEVDAVARAQLMGGAAALLNPIQWEEPFGLVMVEAMACGTPVLATRRGSAPEIIEPGVTGFLGQSEDELVAAIADIPSLSRLTCRLVVEARFSAEAMARNYERVYEDVIERFIVPVSPVAPPLAGAGSGPGSPLR